MNTITHLKVTPKGKTSMNAPYSINLKAAFIDACLKMDASLFESFIDDGEIFEDKTKQEFLKNLTELFKWRKKELMTSFDATVSESYCNGCSEGRGKKVLHFQFFNQGKKILYTDFAYIICELDGIVIDIFQCFSYDSAHCINLNDSLNIAGPELNVNWEILQQEYMNSLKEKARE